VGSVDTGPADGTARVRRDRPGPPGAVVGPCRRERRARGTAPLQSAAAAWPTSTHSRKRILRAERERLENRRYTSTVKTYFRRLEAAVAAGDDEAIEAEHRRLVQTIDKAIKRGALHRKAGARKKSRAARLRASAGADAEAA
jgi:small subunit ribosomal protein S20